MPSCTIIKPQVLGKRLICCSGINITALDTSLWAQLTWNKRAISYTNGVFVLFCFWWSTWLLPLGSALRRVIRWHFLEQNPKNLNLRSQIQQCSSQERLLNQYPLLPAGVLCPGCTLELPGCFNKILWTGPYLRPIKSECPQGGTQTSVFSKCSPGDSNVRTIHCVKILRTHTSERVLADLPNKNYRTPS